MVKAAAKPGKSPGKKGRPNADSDDDAGPSTSGNVGKDNGAVASRQGASIGQQTSGIRNKQKRGELYHKLKHQKEVWCRPMGRGRARGRASRGRAG